MDAFTCVFNAAGDIKMTCVPHYDAFPFKHANCVQASIATMNTLLYKMIRKHKALVEQRDTMDADKFDNLLQFMLGAMRSETNPMTIEEMRVELVTFFVGGHETTATALTWAMYYLAKHPDSQDRLREEVLHELGPVVGDLKTSKPPTYDQLSPKRMPFLDAVIKEVLRLHPAIANVQSRVATKTTTLGPYTIQKGMFVAPSPYSIHRDPSLWSHPDEFQPDRFLKRDPDRHPLAYMPFLLGQRMCIGANFSILEQRVFLSALVRCWHIAPAGAMHDFVVPHFFAIMPNRMHVKLTRRS